MMERQFAKFFIGLVKELLTEDADRERLFEVLTCYQSSQDLLRLMTNLRDVLNEPSKLELYEFLRPLVLLRHQIAYSRRAPSSVGTRLRAVRLQRRVGESLGFAVRGGYEHGTGIFVIDVAPGSQADRQGLRVGDEVVRVNGFTISEAVHDDVLRLIKSRDDIILKVKHIGMIPSREEATEDVTWKYVDDLSGFTDDPLQDAGHSTHMKRARELKIFIDSTGHASIGCSILSESGPAARYPGIFVEKVREGSLAEEVGLRAGDQILEVNGTSFRGITWKEALLALKSSRQLHFVIRKNSLPVPTVPKNETPKPAESQPTQPTPLPVEVLAAPPASAVESPPVLPAEAVPEKRSSPEDQLDEAQIVQHQLDMRAQRTSPSSSISSAASVISTSAQVHATRTPNYTRHGQDKQARPVQNSRESVEDGSSPLGGAAAARLEQRRREDSGKASNSPRLLELEGEFGWTDRVPARIYQKISTDVLDGRPLKCLTYRKTSDLGIAVEGGVGSPLGGKILVSIVFDDGVAKRSGKLHVGDQLMMVNGLQLIDITSTEADRILQDPAKDGDVELIYCESTLVNDEDSVTYF